MNYQKLIVENLDKILSIWLLLDQNQNIIDCSHLVNQHMGYEISDLINQPFEVLLPNDFEPKENYIQQFFPSAHNGTVVNQKTRLKLKNEVLIDIEFSLHRLEDDNESYTLIVFDNITEVVELRKILKAKTERLHNKFNLFENKSIYSSIKEIIDVILVAVTAGQGLKFNRAFLLLVDSDNEYLQGIQAIGPGSGEEAGEIYGKFDHSPKTLVEMIDNYKNLRNTDSFVNQLVRKIQIPLSDQDDVLIKALSTQKYILINDYSPLANVKSVVWLRDLLQVNECLIVPLVAHGQATGILVVDNQVTGSQITNHDIKGITKFSDSAINAIVSTKLLDNLDKSITQVKQANIKIRESQAVLLHKEKLAVMGEMVANMAHEIRGPLALIGGFVSRISRTLNPGDEHFESISIIADTVETLELVLNDILDNGVSKQEIFSGSDCSKTINRVLGLLEEEIHERKISVNLNLQGDLPKLVIRDHHLFEIINNLMRNALEAIGHDGLLIILASCFGDKVVVTIQDTGPGIPSEIEERMFTPFYTTKSEGTGLGLSVVKKLLDENSCDIRIHSIPKNGATFTLSFPIND